MIEILEWQISIVQVKSVANEYTPFDLVMNCIKKIMECELRLSQNYNWAYK